MILLPLGTNTGSIAVSLCTHQFYCSHNQELHNLFKGIEGSVINCTRHPHEINETNPTKNTFLAPQTDIWNSKLQ